MIENPIFVFTTDTLQKCVMYFNKLQLRHLIVLTPNGGNLTGIITR